MSEITTVGIDLAKNILSVHGVDAGGKTVLRKTLTRAKLLELMAQLPACRVGLEACSGAHELARTLTSLGHDARIMAPKFIVPYRKNQKNDGNDAEAICEAVARPNMRFVPIKSAEQQAVRAHQERRTTSGAGSASSQERAGGRARWLDQPGEEPAHRVRHRAEAGPL